MVFCGACGAQQPEASRFCSQCGAKMVAPPSPPRRGASRSSPPPDNHPSMPTAGHTSVRVAKNKFRMVPPFAVGGCLSGSETSHGDNAFARYKRMAVYRAEDHEEELGTPTPHARPGPQPDLSTSEGEEQPLPTQRRTQRAVSGRRGGSATPRAAASNVSSQPPSPAHGAVAGYMNRTPRRRGRAMVPAAMDQRNESAHDHIFPADSHPKAMSPARRHNMHQKTEQEAIREAQQHAGVVRRVRVKKKHLSCKNGMVVDEDNVIAEVAPNGPADVAGARVGMRIISVDGEVPCSAADTTGLMRCKEFALVVWEPEPPPRVGYGRSSSRRGSRGLSPGRQPTPVLSTADHAHHASDSDYGEYHGRSRSRVRDGGHDSRYESPGRRAPPSPHPEARMSYDHREQRAQDMREIEMRHHEFDRSPYRQQRRESGPARSPRLSAQDERARALNERHREKQRLLRELHGEQCGGGGGNGDRVSPPRQRDRIDASKPGWSQSAVAMDISPPPSHKSQGGPRRRDTPSPRARSASALQDAGRPGRKHSPRPCPSRQPLQVNEEFFKATPDTLRPLEPASHGQSFSTAGSSVVKQTKSPDGVVIYHSPRKTSRPTTPPAGGAQGERPAPGADMSAFSLDGPTAATANTSTLSQKSAAQRVHSEATSHTGASRQPSAGVHEYVARRVESQIESTAAPGTGFDSSLAVPGSRPTSRSAASDVAHEKHHQRMSRHADPGAGQYGSSALDDSYAPPPPPRSVATPTSGMRTAFTSRRGAPAHSDDDGDADGTIETLVIPSERQLNTSETWPADPLLTARTTPRHTGGAAPRGKCMCNAGPKSLARAYSCTHCNAPCCMDCYWRGRCLSCAGDAAVDSRFRWSEGPTPAEEKPFRTSKRSRPRKETDAEYAARLLARLSAA